MAEKFVAIDTDFFLKFTEDGKDGKLFIKVMNELQRAPVMHEYVYKEELYGCKLAEQMYREGFIKIFACKDFLRLSDRADYEAAFCYAYKYFNGEKFREDVYTYKHKQRSLGEIRSILMATYLNINMFFSDDKGAKAYVKSHINSSKHPLEVYDIFDICCLLAGKAECCIKWQELKGMAKRELQNKKQNYEELREIWHEDSKDRKQVGE